MGGKMSEGINFSDHLARAVVVVGLPYADSRDPILQEKLRHADALGTSNGETNAGRRLYEAMCMKTVNQSIGRSIRHVRDYSSILLLDKRYGQERVQSQLPAWISECTELCNRFQDAEIKLAEFFRGKL